MNFNLFLNNKQQIISYQDVVIVPVHQCQKALEWQTYSLQYKIQQVPYYLFLFYFFKQKKGVEINALLLTLPPILEFLDDEQREDVDRKVDALHSHWLNLKSLLESRIDLAVIYVKFHSLAVQLANEFDVAEEEFKRSSDSINEDRIRHVEQKWLSIQQLYGQLTNVGKNFTEDASKVC
jgi:hypothetical protein